MEKYDKFVKKILESGAETAKIVDPKIVVTANWVRMKCQFGCGGYNDRLTCPPFSPTPEYTAKMLTEYKAALIFTYSSENEESEKKKRRSVRKVLVEVEREMFLDGYYKAFGLSAGPCNYCTHCDVTKPCKYPEEARPSMEASGIDVYQTARNAGIKIEVVRTLKDICTFVSLILIE
jgi:predicted metal-binding protein